MKQDWQGDTLNATGLHLFYFSGNEAGYAWGLVSRDLGFRVIIGFRVKLEIQ